ncbi:sugar phosphate isomerase/epimerase [Agrococcus versicolor]|uniref:Sugar phosphate isomerase/epimerase n=1 Tax=Agrococcus versicolor TaxID=501482 RepID=A0ABP5MFG5_9MICO
MTHRATALQLYSVRERLDEGLAPALERIAAAGFSRIEPYDLLRLADELRTAMPAAGLTAPTAHARLLGDDQEAVLAAAASLGVATIVDPMTEAERWRTRDDVLRVADDLNAAAVRAAAHGLVLGYHNHAWEAQVVDGDATGLDVLADALDPAVVLEVDAYWAAVGGADVPALLARLGDRVRALHLKDAPLVDGSLSHDPHDQLPVGQGALDWRAILAAAPTAELLVVEFDQYRGDVLEGAAASLAAIDALVA